MKNIFYTLLLLAAVFIFKTSPAQTAMKEQKNSRVNWNIKPFHSPFFIENKGQFNGQDNLPESKINYGVDVDGYQVYFTPRGLTYRFTLIEQLPESKDEQDEKKENYLSEESERRSRTISYFRVNMQWLNSNPKVEMIVQEEVPEFFTYADTENRGKTIGPAHGYKKLIYKNLYPNIDAEYVFHPQEGIKYSLILHPGADITKVKMDYSGAENISKDSDGNILLLTKGGSITDHAPKTFYLASQSSIPSSFSLNGVVVSFDLLKHDASQTVVVDPWVTPVAAQLTANGRAYNMGKDNAGNVYCYGGVGNFKLAKYSSAGAAIWTYATAYGATSWQGDVAVHLSTGDCFISDGCCNNNGPTRQRISSTTGTPVWMAGPSYEIWDITINHCNENQVVTAGFRLNQITGTIGNLNQATGAYTSLANPPITTEFRSLAIAPGGNIYGLTCPLLGVGTPAMVGLTPAFGLLFNIPSTYATMTEGGTLYAPNGFGGQNGVAVDNCFLYTSNGGQLDKRNIATGAILSTFIIPGGSPENCSGVDVDDCGNIYVGSMSGVYQLSNALTPLSFAPTGGAVYDVEINTGGEVLACGNGFVSSSTFTLSVVCGPVSCSGGALTLSVTTTPATCGNSNGSASVTASGGIQPYTYSWSSGQTTSTATGLSQGTYTVTVTTSGGCLINLTTATILNSNGPAATLLTSDLLCYGQCTGAIAANVTGGVQPYTYLWSNGQTTASISSLCAGTYSVQVTSANGCTDVQSVTIYEPLAQNASVSGTNAACNGGTGSATVTVTGGSPPNTFLWDNGQNTQTATGLAVGNHTVAITDANGCITTLTVSVNQPAAMTVSVTTTSTACGSSTGSASASVTSGGTSPFTYVWSNGQSGQNINGLSGGNYIVTVTDASGCTQTQSGSVLNTNGPVTTMSQTNILCNGQCTASATAVVNNGTPAYTYAWSSGQITSAVNNFCAGAYTLVVTDATGCSDVQILNITEPPAINILTSSNPAGCGINNGTAAANVNGGVTPYTYAWSTTPVQNTLSATGLSGGTYTVTVTDANGCIQVATVPVSQPVNTLSVSATSTNATCGAYNGTATAAATGGSGSYSYFWTPTSQYTQTINGLYPGSYTVTITDTSGCVSAQTVLVSSSPLPVAQAGNDVTILVNTSAQLNASGGISYNWSPAAGLSDPTIANPVATPTATTDYCVTATDANGCTDNACVRVSVDMECGSVFVPNAFSPNGDSENDLECVIGNCITTMTFRIYNRWGEKVFETSDRKVCWDGKWRGSLQNAGVYTYYLTGATLQGEKIDRKGNISLIR